MMNDKTGGPAFPSQLYLNAKGMSLRDYFAAKAMQGRSAEDEIVDEEIFARWCYLMADAMLKARDE
jgi:hypothetical protein